MFHQQIDWIKTLEANIRQYNQDTEARMVNRCLPHWNYIFYWPYKDMCHGYKICLIHILSST